jgi:hypothetical protein
MKALFPSSLLILVIALLSGCSHIGNAPEGRSDAGVRTLFKRALMDCQKADCSPVATISLLSSHYWLPESVEPLIGKGTNALPVLKELSRSSGFNEKQLASVCIELIEAHRVEIGRRRTDEKSGITLIGYTATR